MDHEKLTTQLSLGREGGTGGEKQMTAQQIVRDTIQLCIRKENTEQLHLAIFEETKDFLAKQEELLTERGNSIADRMNEEWAHGPEYKAANEQFAVELSDDRNDLDAAWEAMAEWRISIGKMKRSAPIAPVGPFNDWSTALKLASALILLALLMTCLVNAA